MLLILLRWAALMLPLSLAYLPARPFALLQSLFTLQIDRLALASD
jgi:hypothetical protein